MLLVSRETIPNLPPAVPHVFYHLPSMNPNEYLNAIKGSVHGGISPRDEKGLVRTLFRQMQMPQWRPDRTIKYLDHSRSSVLYARRNSEF